MYKNSLTTTPKTVVSDHYFFSWYFGLIKRSDSEAYLKQTQPGSFLVRESETRPGTLSLSVRGENNDAGSAVIKHFCIRTKSETGEVFISNKIEFPNVHELIAYYRQNKGNVHCSCMIIVPARNLTDQRRHLV